MHCRSATCVSSLWLDVAGETGMLAQEMQSLAAWKGSRYRLNPPNLHRLNPRDLHRLNPRHGIIIIRM